MPITIDGHMISPVTSWQLRLTTSFLVALWVGDPVTPKMRPAVPKHCDCLVNWPPFALQQSIFVHTVKGIIYSSAPHRNEVNKWHVRVRCLCSKFRKLTLKKRVNWSKSWIVSDMGKFDLYALQHMLEVSLFCMHCFFSLLSLDLICFFTK